ncbi:hypothetical protein TNCV_3858031 [Trichonephila clavipes]|nr:hypothetical protein TNCV_3858031 [Trichonephila clavipes]
MQVAERFSSVPPQMLRKNKHPGVVHGLPPLFLFLNLTRGFAARRLFKVPPCHKAMRNRRVTSTRVTSMATAFIGKAISSTTVRRRLHMNGLYSRVPRVCVPLSVQLRRA